MQFEKGVHQENSIKLSKFYKALYTGKGQEDILSEYRKMENDDQKKQRFRITKTRTKHLCKQIENIFDKLKTIDKSALSYSQDVTEKAKEAIQKLAIEKRGYDLVKRANLLDANSFCVFSLIEDKPTFSLFTSDQILTYKFDYDNFVYLTIKTKNGFQIYYENKIEIYNSDKVVLETIPTKLCYVKRLGYIADINTNFETCVGLFDAASELFWSLIWDGSELDIIKAVHGIIRTYAYADDCTNTTIIDGQTDRCENGIMSYSKRKCGQCVSGLRIPTSSQDVQYFRRPRVGELVEPLSQMVYHQFIDPSMLEIRKNDCEALEDKIIRTIFNSNFVTQKDITLTATEKKIDNEGVISALGSLGRHVSEVIVWMCKCVADYYNSSGDFYHGYSLDFTFDTIETLVNQRKLSIEANLPKNIIDAIDYAILKKQHIDNPQYLDHLSVWEKFKPFSDKNNEERLAILAMLPNDNQDKILYIYYQRIKNDIMDIYGTEFYKFDYTKQKTLIYNAVEDFRSNI